MWICTTIWYVLLSFSWVSSTFTSTAATLASFSSVSLSLHAACHPDTTECLQQLSPRCRIPLLPCHSALPSVHQPSGMQQLLLFLIHFSDSRIKFFIILWIKSGHLHWWSLLCFRMEWGTFSWTRMGFAWRESLSFSCLSMWMRSSPEG